MLGTNRPMKSSIPLFVTALLIGQTTFLLQAQPVRLALVAETPALQASADLLTVGLSGLREVTVVERAQIDKVLQEQGLAADQRQSHLRLGHLLGADGLISLERRVSATNELLVVRLSAVQPGVVITEHRFPLPLANPAGWGQSLAAQLERWLPKLKLKPAQAVPVSILNLRSSIASAESVALEQNLTSLLYWRLVREPAVFVLERRRLNELHTEKLIDLTETEPFWNGAYVVEGTINRDLISRSNVTLAVRVLPPHGLPTNLEITGRREALGAVVDELARKILAVAERSAVEAWQPEAEAARFLQEATWAWDWHLWPQAAEAADASWALGTQSRMVAAYRLAPRMQDLVSLLPQPSYYPLGPSGFRPPPPPDALSRLAQILELYRDIFRVFAAETNGAGPAWGSVGLDALATASSTLAPYHGSVELCQGHEPELRRARALAREVNGLLTTKAGLGLLGFRRDLGALPGYYLRDSYGSLGIAWLAAGMLWSEQPADALPLYRQLLAPAVYASLRDRFLGEGLGLATWSVADRRQLPSVWLGFLREMAASTNVQARLDGLTLILRNSVDPDELENTARRYVEEAWTLRPQVWDLKVRAPTLEVLSNVIRRVEPWGVPAEASLRALCDDWSQRYLAEAPELSYQVWRELLANLTNPATRSFGFRTPPVPPRPEQVQALLAQFAQIEKGPAKRWNVASYVQQLKRSAERPEEFYGPPAPAPGARPPATREPVATLTLSRPWLLAANGPPEGWKYAWPPTPRAGHLSWHQDHLWMEADLTSISHPGAMSHAFVRVEPRTQRSEWFLIPAERQSAAPPAGGSLWVGDDLYASVDNTLWRRNGSGTWRSFVMPDAGVVCCVWQQQIIWRTGHSLVALAPDTGDVRILASARRRPALTALDTSQPLGEAALAVWPAERLCALIRGRVWAYDSTRKDWSVLLAATNTGESLEMHPTGVVYRQSGEGGPPLLGGWRPGQSLLEYYTWEAMPGSRARQAVAALTPPLWSHPKGFHPNELQVQFDGPKVWVIPKLAAVRPFRRPEFVLDRQGVARPVSDPDAPATNRPALLLLDRRFQDGLELRLRFAGEAAELAEAFADALSKRYIDLELLPTPAGLAILGSYGGLLFWVPQADLDQALAEAARLGAPRARPGWLASQRFDRTQKGWLTDSEGRTMRHDPAWRKELQAESDQAARAALAQHGSAWDALFAQLDAKRLGRLSALQLTEAAPLHPEVFAWRLRGLNGSISTLLHPFDLNKDLALDRSEFRRFLAEPRLLPELAQSPDWLTRFGLQPEQGDTNDDGVLDREERVRASQLTRARAGKTDQSF